MGLLRRTTAIFVFAVFVASSFTSLFFAGDFGPTRGDGADEMTETDYGWDAIVTPVRGADLTVVGVTSYGTDRPGIAGVRENNVEMLTATNAPLTFKDCVFGKNISTGSYGRTGWSVFVSDPYMPNQKPTNTLVYTDNPTMLGESNETLENGTVVVNAEYEERFYYFYEWTVYVDTYFRTYADVRKTKMPQVGVKTWDSLYTLKKPSGCPPLAGSYIYVPQTSAGYFYYTPWQIDAGAGPVDLSMDVFFEVVPTTFGAGTMTENGFEYAGAWAGLMSTKISAFKADYIKNLGTTGTNIDVTEPSLTTGDVTGDVQKDSYAGNYIKGLYDSAASQTNPTGAGTYNPVIDPVQTFAVVIDDALAGSSPVQDAFMTQGTTMPLMYASDKSSTVQPTVFSADLALTNAPSRVEITVNQKLQPSIDLYRNVINYNYNNYKVDHIIGNPKTCLCACDGKYTANYGPPQARAISYDRSATVTNVYSKYTLEIKYVMINDWTKYTKVPVGIIDPLTGEVNDSAYESPLGLGLAPSFNESSFLDYQGLDKSGGLNITVPDTPSPTHNVTSVDDPGGIVDDVIEDFNNIFGLDGLGQYGDIIVFALIGVVAVVVVVFVMKASAGRRAAKSVASSYARPSYAPPPPPPSYGGAA